MKVMIGKNIMMTILTGGHHQRKINSEYRQKINIPIFSYGILSVRDTICSSFLVFKAVISSVSIILGNFLILFTTISRISSKSFALIFNRRSNLPCISCISSTSSILVRLLVTSSAVPFYVYPHKC